jgi:hypothetical protein
MIDLQDAAQTLKDRRRQVDYPKKRLARPEALLAQIHGRLAQLQSQQALLDHRITQPSSFDCHSQADVVARALWRTRIDRGYCKS